MIDDPFEYLRATRELRPGDAIPSYRGISGMAAWVRALSDAVIEVQRAIDELPEPGK